MWYHRTVSFLLFFNSYLSNSYLPVTLENSTLTDVAIIGAGPYGLSCSACLQGAGIDHAIFGPPMQTWREAMPAGMHLKSEGFASNLRDPDRRLTLGAYCAQRNLPYRDFGLPVPLQTFIDYALDFQAGAVPHLDPRAVSSVERDGDGFSLRLADDSAIAARRVIVAVGITYFRYLPPEFAGLPPELLSHSGEHHQLGKFRGRSVTVIGAGASALDTAMLLHEAGAEVQLVARRSVIAFHDKAPDKRSLSDRLHAPRTEIGPGWRSVFYTKAPAVYRQLPEWLRLRQAKRELGPAPGWFVRDRVEGRFPFHLGFTVKSASVRDDRVKLVITNSDGEERELTQDHVIAATGYQADLDRISPIAPELRSAIRRTGSAPLLSSHFESSVPGLYFVGPVATNSFGPVMRFACGSDWVAPRIARHLAARGRTAIQAARPTLIADAAGENSSP